MARERRRISAFSLSFLDIMACGFGAVTLLFLILKHDASTAIATVDNNDQAEARALAEDIRVGERERVELRNSAKILEREIAETQGLSRRVLAQLNTRKRELSVQTDPQQQIALLRKQIDELEKEKARLQEAGRTDDTRSFVGEDDRQYLTGLKLGGQRVLILVDRSASMLAETIVNVVRRRNMSDQVKRQSPKWQRAVRTVEWLVAQLPKSSHYQIYAFNTNAQAVLTESAGQWLQAADAATLDKVIDSMKRVVPAGGTSLHQAFAMINTLALRPDNIFLLTDGLPTQGSTAPRKTTISGKERVRLFNEARKLVPQGVPINVILFPMEGDPAAAALFWQMGLSSKGAFLSPSRDWP